MSRQNNELKQRLEALSGQFVDISPGALGHFVTTDSGYDAIKAKLRTEVSAIEGGTGIFIGAGGLLSLLPDLNIDLAVLLDKAPPTVEFNRLLAKYALASDSAEEVIYRATSEEALEDSSVLRETIDLYGGAGILPALEAHFYKESKIFGEDHWTHPDRFTKVRERLGAIQLASVVADVSREDFAASLRNVVGHHEQYISFANLTNVHNYLAPNERTFAQKWPFSTKAVILLSGYYNSPPVQHPPMEVVTSVEDYTKLAISDPIDLRPDEDKKEEQLKELKTLAPTDN